MMGSGSWGPGSGASGWWYAGDVQRSASAHHAPAPEEAVGFNKALLAGSCIGQWQCVDLATHGLDLHETWLPASSFYALNLKNEYTTDISDSLMQQKISSAPYAENLVESPRYRHRLV